jgi:F-type H+-transporting ATPase subunit b
MDLGALLNDINFDLRAFLFNVVGFLLLLYVANRLVFQPINKVLVERQEDVQTTYDKIEADQRQMETLRRDYEQRLAGIEAEARERIQSAVKEAQAARDQIVTDANARSREMISRAEREALREREEAMVLLRQQIVDLALGATAKIVGEGIDETRQRKLIDDFINNGAGTAAPRAGGSSSALEA